MYSWNLDATTNTSAFVLDTEKRTAKTQHPLAYGIEEAIKMPEL
jgi:hypothetical protein